MATPRLETKRAKSPSGSERRIANRSKSYAEAWTDPGGFEPAILCKIIDISHTGAKLVFAPGKQVPENFILHTGYTKRAATVVWRKENQIGVEFDLRRQSDLQPEAHDPGPPEGVPERRKTAPVAGAHKN